MQSTYTDAQLSDLAALERGLGFDPAALEDLQAAASRLAESGLPSGRQARRLLGRIALLWAELAEELEEDLRAAYARQTETEGAPF